MPVEIHIVFGEPGDLKDRYFYIENGNDRGYFLRWLWKMVFSEQKFGVFPRVLKENEDE